MVDAGRRMACSSLDSGTEDGMPRAWAFCRGQMPREDGETERTRRRVGDYSGELWRFASAAAEGWVTVRSTGARNRVRLIGEKSRLDKGMIRNIQRSGWKVYINSRNMCCILELYTYLSDLSRC